MKNSINPNDGRMVLVDS